ncbi:hypothetical protein ACIBF7_32925 [Nonomuraea sp. NPDC050478]
MLADRPADVRDPLIARHPEPEPAVPGCVSAATSRPGRSPDRPLITFTG